MSNALSRRFWLYVSTVMAIVAMLVVLSIIFMPRVQGQGVGDGTIGSCGYNYCTDNGFGWKKYPVSGNGPSGGLTGWQWSTVKSTCQNVESVWLFVVKSTSTPATWRAFSYTYGDGIQDDLSGQYMKDNYEGDDTPANVHTFYDEALAQGVSGMDGKTITWGNNLEWFCYGQKPWKVKVATSASPALVEVGQTVTWKHGISVSENKTTVDVTWKAFNSGALGSDEVQSWTYTKGKTKSNPASEDTTYIVQPADFGKKLCRYTYAAPASDKGGDTKTDPVCVTVVKRPKVQVHGGDFNARGVITTSTSTINGKQYGSWGEYAVSATGTITNMSSGAGLAGGAAVNTCALNALTFANVTSPATQCNASTKYGGYNSVAASTIEAIVARFPVSSSTQKLSANTDVAALNSGLTYTAGATTISLSSSATVAKGKWVIINAPTATVKINQNITYANGPFASSSDIPQIVIIAKTIVITDNVTQVDAWLIAKDGTGNGVLKTCDAAGDEPKNLSAAVCNKQLTINGPVSTDRILLYRTYGAGSGALTQAAEVFNLRPDAYLWATVRDEDSGRIQTTTIKEVPPRF